MSETEERLRTWPLDQSAQERLCLGILSLDARFAEVKPRRPKGGPEGARDIEAVFQNQKVWGAVGFRKSVKDDSNDKRWVQKKFKHDDNAAKKVKPALWGFIFFSKVRRQGDGRRCGSAAEMSASAASPLALTSGVCSGACGYGE